MASFPDSRWGGSCWGGGNLSLSAFGLDVASSSYKCLFSDDSDPSITASSESIQPMSSTLIHCITPAWAAVSGVGMNATVELQFGSMTIHGSMSFVFDSATINITSFSPTLLPPAGNHSVNLTVSAPSGFDGVRDVLEPFLNITIGGLSCRQPHFVGNESIHCISPAGEEMCCVISLISVVASSNDLLI